MSFLGGPERISALSGGGRHNLRNIERQVGSQIGRGVDWYGGQIIPGAAPIQQDVFDVVGGWFGRGGPGASPPQAQQAAINSLMSGAPAYQIDPAQREAYYEQTVLNPARAQFGETIKGLDQRYGNRWNADTGAHRAAIGDAASDFATNLAAERGQLVWQDEQARRMALENAANRRLGGVQASMAQRGDELARLGFAGDVGNQQRSIEAQQLGENYYKWQAEQAWANPWLGFLQQTISPSYGIANKPGWGEMAGGVLTGLLNPSIPGGG